MKRGKQGNPTKGEKYKMAIVPLHGQIGCSSKNNVVPFVPRNETVIVPIPAHLKESDIGAVICSGNSLEAEGILNTKTREIITFL